MNKKLLTATIAGAFVLSLLGTTNAHAASEKDGAPSNKHGKCTSYFNGDAKDSDDDFQGYVDAHDLANGGGNEDITQAEEDAEGNLQSIAGTGEQAEASDTYEYCEGDVSGQPEHNGAWDCQEPDGVTRDVDADDEVECYDNTGLTGTWLDTDYTQEDQDAGQDESGTYDTGGDHPGGGKGH